MLACECGSRRVRITDSWELATDENGNVTKFEEEYECQACRRDGRLEHQYGTDHLYGCLTHSGGGF
jgi:hypothetical protein